MKRHIPRPQVDCAAQIGKRFLPSGKLGKQSEIELVERLVRLAIGFFYKLLARISDSNRALSRKRGSEIYESFTLSVPSIFEASKKEEFISPPNFSTTLSGPIFDKAIRSTKFISSDIASTIYKMLTFIYFKPDFLPARFSHSISGSIANLSDRFE